MNDFEKKIYTVVASKTGVTGSEIAKILEVEKQQVNSLLYKSSALKAVLEQDPSTYKWYVKNSTNKQSNSDEEIPNADKDLRNICNYYLNCIIQESSSALSQFISSYGGNKYAVMSSLDINDDSNINARYYIQPIASKKNATVYLGYPTRIFTIHSNKGSSKKLAPVFLFPVDISGGKVEVSWIPSINTEIIKAFAGDSADSIAVELVNLETELGMNNPDNEIDVEELVLKLRNIRDWDWAEEIDPYAIPGAISLDGLNDGIYNRPVILEAERQTFTQGLESELIDLAKMPEEKYRDTALYSWIKGFNEQEDYTENKQLLEVLPLNSEQAQAVETALTSPLTIVTGPPGTGKSQVVTDLLINIAWNGKSALFSSYNNKAVDVVDVRVNSLSMRPVLLRFGGTQYASRLADIISGILNSQPNASTEEDMRFYLKEYETISEKSEKLKQKKTAIFEARNRLDAIEQEYCEYRDLIDDKFDSIEKNDARDFLSAAKKYVDSFKRTIKEEQGLFAKLFWSSIEPKRKAQCENAANEYNAFAEKYDLTPAFSDITAEEEASIVEEAEIFGKAIEIATKYKNELEAFKKFEHLEDIDRKLLELKDSAADVAANLWDKWLLSQTVVFGKDDKRQMIDYVNAMKLYGDVDISQDKELRDKYNKMAKKMTGFLNLWAVTSLSAKSRIPFTAGLFDYVIIDEASQCDIASILPLLYRAKKAVIIGDPKQLKHISNMPKEQDRAFLKKFNVSAAWSYSVSSLYDLASSFVDNRSIIQLRDHFRSCEEIIEFSNNEFYDGSLRTVTKYNKLKTPAGEKPGIRWVDVRGKSYRPDAGSLYNSDEAAIVVSELKRLVDSGYTGTIGVTTPFKRQAEEIRNQLEKYPKLYNALTNNHEFIVDTVHKFQGDERDLMIFSTTVSNGTPVGSIGFLKNTGNLFNVAITRARAVLVVVGNYGYCKECDVPYLNKFTEYYRNLAEGQRKKVQKIPVPTSREYPKVQNSADVSIWEKTLFAALYDAGFRVLPQYPVDRYLLDFALITADGRKLDIEVDGTTYHRNWNGELCYRDQIRNQRMFELGWDVKRFWVYQIRNDMSWCVNQIKEWSNN